MFVNNRVALSGSHEETKTFLEQKNILVKDYDNYGLYLVKYDKPNCDMTDSDVQKCRGLIIDKETNSVVCYPPPKSMIPEKFMKNVNNWDDVTCEKFIDGTMINIFYHNNEWKISTRSCIGARNRWFSNKSFVDMFNECKNFDMEKLDKECCYSFVLTHKDNRIVKEYNESGICLVYAMRKTETSEGRVFDNLDIKQVQSDLKKLNIVVNIPETITFISYEDARINVNKLDYQEQGYVFKMEGFRSKLRNINYDWVKRLRGNTNNMKYLYLELRQNNALNDYEKFFPEHKEMFNYFQNELYGMTHNLFKFYKDLHVNKTKKIQDIPFEYRRILFSIHGIYLADPSQPTTFARIKNFVNRMDVPHQMFVINYKYRPQRQETNETQQVA
jgi:hypothetical protein